MSDIREYATGDNPNPADIPADVSGRPKGNWETAYLESRENQLIDAPWFPRATGQPGAPQSKRYDAFTAPDESKFQAAVSPQKWDCTPAMNIPVNDGLHGGPVQVVEMLPARASVTVINTGTNNIVISPTLDRALAGSGITVAPGSSFAMDCQGPAWAWALNGPSSVGIVEVMWTYWSSPTSNLPPKGTD